MNNMLEWDHGKYCNNVAFRRKFNKELLSVNHVAFLKKKSVVIGNIWLRNHQKWCWIRYGRLPLGVLYNLYYLLDTHIMLSYLEACRYWENWKIDCLVWTMLSFQKKLKTGLFGLSHVFFFMTLVENSNMFQ